MITSWSPDHPLAIGFSVRDDVPYRAGSPPHPLTAAFGERLLWWTERSATFLKPNSVTPVPNTLFSGPIHHFQLSVSLTEAPRQDDRSQWRIHVSSDPVFAKLVDFQQGAARIILGDLAELATAWQETEDVEITLV
jgi:hypothetical protein